MNDQYNLTPCVQQVLSLARKEADRFNHNYVGTEHLLLGLIRLGRGVAVNVLQQLGLDLDTVRFDVEKRVGNGPNQKVIGDIPYTLRVKKVFLLANKEAKDLGYSHLDTDIILLGILREGHGIAAKVLLEHNVQIDMIRQEIIKGGVSKDVPGVGSVFQNNGFDMVNIKRFGDQFVADMEAAVLQKPCREESPFNGPDETWIFLYLETLLVAGYTFQSISLNSILQLSTAAKTLKRLDIICEIVKRSWSGDKFVRLIEQVQQSYDATSPNSESEARYGCLLQRLTGGPPRKMGPPVDWLSKEGLVRSAEAGGTGQEVTGGTPVTQSPPDS